MTTAPSSSSKSSSSSTTTATAEQIVSFPRKLYNMLENAELQRFDDVVSWQSQGKSFKIHKPDVFERAIMPTYFQGKFKSFQRQLNIYGWKKIQIGPNKGGMINKHFIRGQPGLLKHITRRHNVKNTTTGNASASTNSNYSSSGRVSPKPMGTKPKIPQSSKLEVEPIDLNEDEVKTFYDFFYPQDPVAKSHIETALSDDDSIDSSGAVPLEYHRRLNSLRPEDLDGFIEMFTTNIDSGDEGDLFDEDIFHSVGPPLGARHTKDFSMTYVEALLEEPMEHNVALTAPTTTSSPSTTDAVEDELGSEETSFPFKLHMMLENAERDGYADVVNWVKDGKAFKVFNHEAFLTRVMPIYFDQSKYESFRRQLNLYNFTRISRGKERGIIFHPNLVQGERHLCKKITRHGAAGKHTVGPS